MAFEANRGARVPMLSVDDAIENATLRRAVEVELLRQAVPNLTAVDDARAAYVLDATMSAGSVTETNWQFHRAIYEPARWPRGLAIAEVLHASMAPYVLLYLRSLGGSTPSDDEHRAILDACRSRDVDAATGLLEMHLEHAMNTVIAFLRPGGQRA